MSSQPTVTKWTSRLSSSQEGCMRYRELAMGRTSVGEMLTNMTVFESPPSESCRKYVSFELRYGTCLSFLRPQNTNAL